MVLVIKHNSFVSLSAASRVRRVNDSLLAEGVLLYNLPAFKTSHWASDGEENISVNL